MAGAGVFSALGAILSTLGILWYIFIWTLCLFGLHRARVVFAQPPRLLASQQLPSTPGRGMEEEEDRANLPGVSILRPLAGSDANLYANLASTFQQDYPAAKHEVIFSVSSEEDAALPIVRRVVAEYAAGGTSSGKVKAQIIVGDVKAGVNPKVNNLLRPYSLAQHDILWIVDSQVRLCSSTLRSAVAQLLAPSPTPSPTWLHRRPHGSRVGLLHCVPLGVDHHEGSLASLVERVFLSTTHAKMYLAMNALAVESCVMGKSNMWRKSDLEQVPDSFFAVGLDGSREEDPEGALGSPAFQVETQSSQARPFVLDDEAEEGAEETGEEESLSIIRQARPLARFSIYLAEDNMVATSLWRPPLSLSHVLASGSACIARTNVGEIRTLADYIGRRSRWIRVRRHMVPEATIAEPLTESPLAGLVGFCSLRFFGLWPSGLLAATLFFLVHFTGWYLVDFAVLAALESGSGEWSPQAEERGSTSGTQAESRAQHTSPPPAPRLFTRKGERWEFTKAWILREALALPIFCWSIWGGNEVNWRGQPYRILSDSRAAQILPHAPTGRRRGTGLRTVRGAGAGTGAGGASASRAEYQSLPSEE
ncbi:hypothetical protein BCV69DRAFT_281667 [Microstroma glucosiphilum]|uniref:Ceramide glucosyltransferase n=1 Tax=Pseudomicrostroma glucosiphilum TaxID=1684307 RepID=A0A316U903_9BASI|nr:hypothetical protein BCV69DRAFT_281667 [Pseudomicrostroma glucosiphilum]PWN21737.1 hypothetical protein BCV69DRAFT_281667 [Pseudomicrostroma glucosiphilum]